MKFLCYYIIGYLIWITVARAVEMDRLKKKNDFMQNEYSTFKSLGVKIKREYEHFNYPRLFLIGLIYPITVWSVLLEAIFKIYAFIINKIFPSKFDPIKTNTYNDEKEIE